MTSETLSNAAPLNEGEVAFSQLSFSFESLIALQVESDALLVSNIESQAERAAAQPLSSGG